MINWVPNKKINTKRVNELLELSVETNQFTNYGPNVKLLEEKMRDLLKIDNTKSVICVSNGTVALWAAVAAFEMYKNRDLQFYTQSFTFPASAQGYLDNVKIIDIDKDGGLDLDLVDIDTCDGIIVTNVFGNIVDIEKYELWCKKNNKFLVFDNAATSFTLYKGKNSCNYGNASTISFHHTKPIGFGEGGAIIIDSIYEKTIRMIINFGIDNNALNPSWHRKGSNYKMSDIQAVYINQYLDNFNKVVSHTEELYSYFCEKVKHLDIKLFPNFSYGVPFISCICLFSKKSNKIIDKLLKNSIYSRKYYYPLLPTKVSVSFFENIVCIPCTIDMNKSHIDTIINLIDI
jgi:dTDP-4-amino-4,6-dideoxygalactose transaminase